MFGDGATLWLKAPAKINLLLEILGQRANGYHDLRSVVVPVSLYDHVALEPTADGITTVVEGDADGAGDAMEERACTGGLAALKPDDNLATRAATLLKADTGHAGGVRIHLRKHIPVGGGLGGGSADAAAVLMGLNRLWNTGLTTERLMALGAQVGCDVPALIRGGPVCMEGVGETITPLRVADGPRWAGWWLVLVYPGFGVPTRDIYARCKTSLTSEGERFRNVCCALEGGDAAAAAAALFNGLQDTVLRKYPIIGIVLERLEKAGATGSLVSGSGASVFGLARNEEHAREIAAALVRTLDFPAWHAIVRTLPDGVMVAHGPLEA